jgi:NAD(P)-dependent dehydrogenase (short-subunit alcohol dehydrogenase family)
LLVDKVAVVTGAANGIGAATAQLFAEHGATVYIADIDAENSALVAKDINDAGGQAIAVTTDVRVPEDVDRLRVRVLEEQGRADVLVNNVGHWVAVKDMLQGDPDHWQALYEVNLLHIFRVTHSFLPSMVERGSGAIVNVTSIEGVRGYPQDPVYGAFKAAVVNFTKSLGIDMAPRGIKVHCIAPDLTNSVQSDFLAWDPPEWADQWHKWLPLGRMGMPIDQARVILFLASEMSDFMVGQTLNTDGGTAAAAGWYRTSNRPNRRWTNRPVDP